MLKRWNFLKTGFYEGINLGGTRVTVPQGSEVDVYVTLESTAPTEGLLEVLVLRDIILDADLGKKLCTNLVILSTGSQEIRGCDFLADDLTTGTLRQYYIQVFWNNALIYDPIDPNTREFVLTEPALLVAPTPTPTPAPGFLPTPVQIAPPHASVFNHFPRDMQLQWEPVSWPRPLTYVVEIDCFHCCVSGQWCTDVERVYFEDQTTATSLEHSWVGAQPGRWRVWWVDDLGNESPKSDWWNFEFTV